MRIHRPILFTMSFLAVIALAASAQIAQAAVPAAIGVEGVLQSGAGPTADGNYKLTFSLYKDASGGVPQWSEVATPVPVKNGQFAWQLGSATPLPGSLLANLPAPWLGVSVGDDPEMPRKPLLSVPFSLRAGMAEGLDCSACVTLQALDPKVFSGLAKTADLAKVATSGQYADLQGIPALAASALSGKYADLIGLPDLSVFAQSAALAKVATSGQFSDLLGAPDTAVFLKKSDVASVATTGAYADLSGGIALGKSCGSGLVLRGFNADGSYDCVASLDVNNLPADGLAKVSNGLLTDQITDTAVSSTTPVKIPDYNPKGVSDTITWPDYGTAQGINITVDIANSDVSKFFKVLVKSPDGVSYTLYDSTGSGNTLKTAFSDKSKIAVGSLGDWVGKNPKGVWTLTVVDNNFSGGGNDGQLNSWSLTVQTLSGKKVKALGLFQFQNAVSNPVPCDLTQAGATYYNTQDKALYICNGTDYFPLMLVVVGTQQNPGASCKDILTKMPSAKDGNYWILQNNVATQVVCDMTTDGGGWTQIALENTADAAGWSDGTLTNATVAGAATQVHGMWGTGGGGYKTFATGFPHTQARIRARYYAIDSWDNENNGAQCIVDGGLVWSKNKQYGAPGAGPGWIDAAFAPAPWGGAAEQGYWTVETGLGLINHGAATLKLEFRTGLDQAVSDESFGFSHVQVWVR